eukprot:gene4669-6560_t
MKMVYIRMLILYAINLLLNWRTSLATSSPHNVQIITNNDLENAHLVTLQFKFEMLENRVGNFLAFYFEGLSCAATSGAAFQVTFLRQINGQVGYFVHQLILSLPSKSNAKTLEIIKEKCQCAKFCYSYFESTWYLQTELIRKSFNQGLDKFIAHEYGEGSSLLNLSLPRNGRDEKNSNNALSNGVYPLIPDVTIQYRCSDIITVQSGYGFLNFHVYTKIIPLNAKFIYIVSDSPSRANEGAICKDLLDNFFNFLTLNFPSALIHVKRGGAAMLSIVQLVHSNITICSASTFCFWPALASRRTVYFPVTNLILNSTTPQFTSNFHWIVSPLMYHKADNESVAGFINRLKKPLQSHQIITS